MSSRQRLADGTGCLDYDPVYGMLQGTLPSVPADGTAGWAKGATLQVRNGTSGNLIYLNCGSQTSSSFRSMDPNVRTYAAGSTLAMSQITHSNGLILLDTAAGSTVTLPASTGSGVHYTFVVHALATSNSHIIKVANVSDAMIGFVFTMSDDAGAPVKGYFAVAGTDDTITLNRSTTGSVTKGEYITITDYALNLYMVQGFTSATGTEATPFSATV